MTIESKLTRFRAYQICSAGASFSYYDGLHFTLIEARYSESNMQSISMEMESCGVDRIHNLHITSWDQDHCSPAQLEQILDKFSPSKIECPGYDPHSDCGKESLQLIRKYKSKNAKTKKVVAVTPEYISSLDLAEEYGYKNILYHPKFIDKVCLNNNSTIKQFRSGSFNVLSLGDVESTQISSGLSRQRTINSEIDVMILAHHGADNGFTTSSFIKKVKPSVAIACANYANQFEHPKREIRALLHKHNVNIFTTKTGDVLIKSLGNHKGRYRVINLNAGSSEISSTSDFNAKKNRLLRQNSDTILSRINKTNKGPRH